MKKIPTPETVRKKFNMAVALICVEEKTTKDKIASSIGAYPNDMTLYHQEEKALQLHHVCALIRQYQVPPGFLFGEDPYDKRQTIALEDLEKRLQKLEKMLLKSSPLKKRK